MVEFCREHGIHCEVCGKVIVATKQAEILLLENLFQSLTSTLHEARIRKSVATSPRNCSRTPPGVIAIRNGSPSCAR